MGCTTNPTSPQTSGSAVEARPITEEGMALAAGRYTYEAMSPQIEVTVPDGWQNAHLLPEFWDVARLSDGAYAAIAFMRPTRIIGTGSGSPAATPQDAVALLEQNPGLEVSEPQPVEVAGLSGLEVDLFAPHDDTQVLGGEQDLLGIGPGNDIRLAFLPEEDGVLVVGLITPTGEMDAFAAEAQPVLASISID